MISGWWVSLHELSEPRWRPPSDRTQGTTIHFDVAGTKLVPAAQTLESVEAGFVAASVRWWKVRGKKPVEMVESTRETTNSPPICRSTPIPKHASRFRRLIELAADQHQPIWVEGDRETVKTAGELLAPSHPRMFAWLIAGRSRRGVLEVVFDADRNGLNGRDREIYLRALHLLREDLYRKMVSVPEPKAVSPMSLLGEAHSHLRSEQAAEVSVATLAELALILDEARIETIRKIEGHLHSLAGARMDSLLGNQMLAKSLHQMLDSHGFRIRCPECGEPAIMRCLAAGNSQTGSFVFDHVLSQGRTFHGGRSSVPKLEVVPKPTRRS